MKFLVSILNLRCISDPILEGSRNLTLSARSCPVDPEQENIKVVP